MALKRASSRFPGSNRGQRQTSAQTYSRGRSDTAALLLTTGMVKRGRLNIARPLPRTRAVIQGARGIAGPLRKAAGPAFKGKRDGTSQLAAVWPSIVGETLAAFSCPEHYQPGKGAANNGVLTIRVDGALALDLQHLAPQILERVNGHFGYRAVARLALTQGPLPGRQTKRGRPLRALDPQERADLDRRAGRVADDGLKRALRTLGQSVYGRGDKQD